MSQQSHSFPVSPLRQRMLEDMAMRGLREKTQHDYIHFVRGFAAFLGPSPAPGPKYKAALGTAYGAGLRVSEWRPSRSTI